MNRAADGFTDHHRGAGVSVLTWEYDAMAMAAGSVHLVNIPCCGP
jgi:hypothetical protein